MNEEATGVTVTATPYRDGRFLLVRRSTADATLPGYWAFPGGRVQYERVSTIRSDGTTKVSSVTETLTEAAQREVAEETGLKTTGRAFYVDSYPLGERAAAHFCIEVADGEVQLEEGELVDYRWITTLEEMDDLVPLIPGLKNHLARILDEMARVYDGPFRPLAELDLIPSRYLNT